MLSTLADAPLSVAVLSEAWSVRDDIDDDQMGVGAVMDVILEVICFGLLLVFLLGEAPFTCRDASRYLASALGISMATVVSSSCEALKTASRQHSRRP